MITSQIIKHIASTAIGRKWIALNKGHSDFTAALLITAVIHAQNGSDVKVTKMLWYQITTLLGSVYGITASDRCTYIGFECTGPTTIAKCDGTNPPVIRSCVQSACPPGETNGCEGTKPNAQCNCHQLQ